MNETPCPERGQIIAFYRGELRGSLAEKIAAHVGGCAICRALVGSGLETVDLQLEERQETDSRSPPAADTGLASAPTAAFPGASPRGYRLLDEIGRGAVGVVYRAHDVRLNRLVAVKVLREDHLPGSVAALRFIAEARIAAGLPHPGIPAVHELGLLPDGRPFLVMRLVQGRTLQEMLQQRPTSAADQDGLLDVFHHICQAVACAHAHRIIHRDLKPHNVMVGAFGEVQVMDWGLAKVLGAPDPLEGCIAETRDSPPTAEPADNRIGGSKYTTRSGAVLGTPAYMAPEQAAGDVDRLDPRTDVFSLGAILCQILTGQPPYCAEAGANLDIRAVPAALEEAWARLEECSAGADLVALCKRCLASNQQDRPADARAVADQLQHIRLATQERLRRAELEKEQAVGRQAEQRRRRRRLAVLLAVAAALLVLAWLAAALGTERIWRPVSY